MAFWGVEVKPGTPFTHQYDDSKGRLHISMGTLGLGTAEAKSTLQCNIGNKSPVYLCSLYPGHTESLQLNLEFEELDNDVTFSVIGTRSIHLSGYYLAPARNTYTVDVDDLDSLGEDIANTESEKSENNDKDGTYEDSFIDDDNNPEVFPPYPISKEGKKGGRRRLRKKHQTVDSDDDRCFKEKKSVDDQSKDIDNEGRLPNSSLDKNKASERGLDQEMDDSVDKGASDAGNKIGEDGVNSITETDNDNEICVSRRLFSTQTNQMDRETIIMDKILLSDEVCQGQQEKPEKKRKDCSNEGKFYISYRNRPSDEHNKQDTVNETVDDGAQDFPDGNQSEDKKVKKRKIKSRSQVLNSDMLVSVEQSNEMLKEDAKPSQVRTLSNGLVIEELATGIKDGKIATLGKKISINYTGKLKESGSVFETNADQAPFKFRLGKGKAIKGWDVGLEGMRVGERRRLVIPPSMAFESDGYGDIIPPNSWLVYDMELVKVH